MSNPFFPRDIKYEIIKYQILCCAWDEFPVKGKRDMIMKRCYSERKILYFEIDLKIDC